MLYHLIVMFWSKIILAPLRTNIVIDHDNQFKYFFMALDACISRFRTSIRLIITIDGTFFKAKYLETLFVVACKDGNNQIYPLCFRIGDSENDASWEWFLKKLHGAIGHVDDLMVVSDHHNNIEKVVQKVFPHVRVKTNVLNLIVVKFF